MAIFIAICCFAILLGFEIRYRTIVEELNKLKTETDKLSEEVITLKREVAMKQNVYEEHNRPV
jgi:hypothetical protein